MIAARRQGAFGAMTGWWATAARMLALVLALALAAPATGLAGEPHGHRGDHARTGIALASADGSHAADPDTGCQIPGCHVHCGCHFHAAAGPDAAPASTGRRTASRARYAWTSEAPFSVSPGRLPRPPRA